MALFLGGGGDAPLARSIDAAFASAVGGGAVVYLPIALRGSPLFERAPEWFADTFGPLGVTDVDTWDHLAGRSLESVHHLAGVYIGGGNTYLLLDELRRTGVDVELRAAVARGVHVAGGSAGAIVLGADITVSELGGDERVPATDVRTHVAGLDVLAGWSVSCHYTPEHDVFLDAWVASHSPALVLPEDAGVVVDGDHLTVVGSGAGLRTRAATTWLGPGTLAWPPPKDDPA